MLSCYRILDICYEKGDFCGRALGDLGADVIKIEPPTGSPARYFGPYYHNDKTTEKSLSWLAFNANKRGITLDLDTTEGREIFKKLIQKADAVIEGFQPGHMENIGLSYGVLSRINPGLIMTSITSFGQEGPYRDYKAPDIVMRALGGMLYTVGDEDRPPLTTGYQHAYLIGAMHGAVATAIALMQRGLTGRGQHVDIPTQMGLAFVGNVESQVPWLLKTIIPGRNGRKRFPVSLKDGSLYYQPMLWKCKDGDVAFTVNSAGMASGAAGLIEYMKKDGIDAGPLEKWDWRQVHDGEWTKEEFDGILKCLGELFSRHTKDELLKISLEKGIQLGICLNAEGALNFPQLVERDFWKTIEHPELGAGLPYPGGFARFSDAECGIRFCAPQIGQHNAEIYGGELGMTQKELADLKKRHII
jgi:crotonobetainyl-CoA:carnitine CoA-transferase CaiB-like acyl-CoA transferase